MYVLVSFPLYYRFPLRRPSLHPREKMQPKRAARQHKYEKDANLPSGLRTLQVGAWRVVYQDKRKRWPKFPLKFFAVLDLGSAPAFVLKSFKESCITRYLIDVYHATPGLLVWYLFVNAIVSLQSALELQTSNRLFNAVT